MRALRQTLRWRPGLVGSFALASLMAFAVLWGALSFVVSRQVVRSGEQGAQFHAEFVTDSILRYEVTPGTWPGPSAVRPTGRWTGSCRLASFRALWSG